MADFAPQPFIIWTQRRTGGTTLTALLAECAGLAVWEDEAFNADRELGAITRGFEADGDAAALEAPIAAVLAQGRILKHCLETVPWAVTRALLRRSRTLGYRHVLLLRRDETQRQLSLILAEMTGAWGPAEAALRYRDLAEGRLSLPPADLRALAAQIDSDAASLGRMMRAFLASGVEPHTLFYEDLFTGPAEQRRSRLDVLADDLGLPRRAGDDPVVHEALMGRWQKTRTIYSFLPNLHEAMALIEAAS